MGLEKNNRSEAPFSYPIVYAWYGCALSLTILTLVVQPGWGLPGSPLQSHLSSLFPLSLYQYKVPKSNTHSWIME